MLEDWLRFLRFLNRLEWLVHGGWWPRCREVHRQCVRGWLHRGAHRTLPMERLGTLYDIDGYRIRLHNVHDESKCAGRTCVIHNRSDHPMRSWPVLWRSDRSPGLFERLCPEHGTGHPDPDQEDYWRETGREWMTTHGCCGCCETSVDSSL